MGLLLTAVDAVTTSQEEPPAELVRSLQSSGCSCGLISFDLACHSDWLHRASYWRQLCSGQDYRSLGHHCRCNEEVEAVIGCCSVAKEGLAGSDYCH